MRITEDEFSDMYVPCDDFDVIMRVDRISSNGGFKTITWLERINGKVLLSTAANKNSEPYDRFILETWFLV